MEGITKFIECLAPVSVCNLECEYCYLIQQNRRKMVNPKWEHSVEDTAKALSKKRLGGMAYISICGEGETLISDDVVKLAYLLLENGHAVNITTNGTVTNNIEKLAAFPQELVKRLNISFSFHYLELEKKKLTDTFFSNIKKVKEAGASFVLQLNLCDSYIPHIEDIKRLSIENVGALPQIALTRREKRKTNEFEIYTDLTEDEYIKYAREFNSPLFECTYENFNKKRCEFCNAGAWSGVLNLKTGNLERCYGLDGVNIFDNVDKPIKMTAVGKHCPQRYCINSSHFMALGIIPEADIKSYGELRNRENAGWYNDTMKKLLYTKLGDVNPPLSNKEIDESEKSFKRITRRTKLKKLFPTLIKNLIKKIMR